MYGLLGNHLSIRESIIFVFISRVEKQRGKYTQK